MKIATPSGTTGTSTAEHELLCYEHLRDGRRDAFVRLAVDLDPVLRDLALASTWSSDAAAALLRRTWHLVLGGLDLFAWRCSLRAWVAGTLVGLAHGPEPREVGGGAIVPDDGCCSTPADGPIDWRDLPWGARWSSGLWEALEEARSGLEAVQRQVLVLGDVHGWPERDAADALGLAASRYTRELGAARLAVHDRLARLIADRRLAWCGHDRVSALAAPEAATTCVDCAVLAARWRATTTLLAATAARPPSVVDPQLLALFRRWRAARRHRLLARLTRVAGDLGRS